MYKGALRNGRAVAAALRCDGANQGPALLVLAYAKTGEGEAADSVTVAPGAEASVQVALDGKGMVRVFADLSGGADGGQLDVREGSDTVTGETIQGDTTWTYTVV